jgi:hypothetical protein
MVSKVAVISVPILVDEVLDQVGTSGKSHPNAPKRQLGFAFAQSHEMPPALKPSQTTHVTVLPSTTTSATVNWPSKGPGTTGHFGSAEEDSAEEDEPQPVKSSTDKATAIAMRFT